MFNKLAFRNIRRSIRDYLIYILTMTVITAFMYTFISLIFNTELSRQFEIEGIMQAMIGIATFFIVLITAWLINYMIRFMLEKRSVEFGTYLLLGIKKKKIARLYMRENILLGIISFVPGLLSGVLLQQILMAILSHMIRTEYEFHLSFDKNTFLVTSLCFGGCYLLALLRCGRKFSKMNIQALMKVNRQNEEIRESHETVRKIILPASLVLILAFWIIFPTLTSTGSILLFLVLLIADIYLFYMGLSAWIICYVRDRKNGIYKGQNLFLLRQFSSKIRTMQFTMGTLTALFTVALMGCSMAMMFSDFENKILDTKWPFDVLINSTDPADDFQNDIELVSNNTQINDQYIYRICTDGRDMANTWILTHLSAFGAMYLNDDHQPDMDKVRDNLENDGTYCRYDTYIGISDYNYLRKMLGYPQITLKEDQYAIQIKSRLLSDAGDMPEGLQIPDASGKSLLTCEGIYSDSFAQDGHNGGDYLLVVPDSVIRTMTPYYSEIAFDIEGNPPSDLQQKLDNLSSADLQDYTGHVQLSLSGNSCSGSDTIVVYCATNLVGDNLIPEVKYMLASLIIPGIYIGLVFLCVALTVLSVHQLSDSARYKYRYDVLRKIGLEQAGINRLIRKQLTAYYLCPALFALLICGSVILRISNAFIRATGIHSFGFQYLGISVLLFFGIYAVYFLATYVGFKRNINEP